MPTAAVQEELGYLIKVVQHSLRIRMDHALDSLGLTTPQFAALNAMRRLEQPSNAELARAAFVTSQSMHAVVAGLERDGLVRRSAHPTHGRIRTVTLTSAGARRLDHAAEVVAEIERVAIDGLNPPELQQTRRTLEAILANLDRRTSEGRAHHAVTASSYR